MAKTKLCKHTQAFLNESASPTHAPRATVTSALEQLVTLSEGLDLQSRTWARKLQLSERTQSDDVLRSMYEEVYQTTRALQREIGEADAALRKVSSTEAQFHRIVDRMKVRAAELGYEVGDAG